VADLAEDPGTAKPINPEPSPINKMGQFSSARKDLDRADCKN